MKKDAEKLGKAGSRKQAAAMMAHLGVSVEMLKAAKNAGCPGIDDHDRYDCDLVWAWLERPENQGLMSSPTVRKAHAEARHEELKVERIEHRVQVEKGKWLLRAEVVRRNSLLVADVQKVFRAKVENEFPMLMDGKSIEERRKICKDVVDQVYLMMQPLVKDWCSPEC